ncbi:hypothetical protein [Streptomyces bauhiniae]|uniref:hypothetical protein n=1 Tax=Streptomyces bauhiniae TaxID=2340725 RepID=UPI003664B4FF
MREINAMRTAVQLLEPLERRDRADALAWLSSMFGEDTLPPEHLATAEAALSDTHLPYGLFARRTTFMALTALDPAARRRSIQWLESRLLLSGPASRLDTSAGPPTPEGQSAALVRRRSISPGQ